MRKNVMEVMPIRTGIVVYVPLAVVPPHPCPRDAALNIDPLIPRLGTEGTLVHTNTVGFPRA